MKIKNLNLTLEELDKLGLIDKYHLYYIARKVIKVKKFLCFKISYKKTYYEILEFKYKDDMYRFKTIYDTSEYNPFFINSTHSCGKLVNDIIPCTIKIKPKSLLLSQKLKRKLANTEFSKTTKNNPNQPKTT